MLEKMFHFRVRTQQDEIVREDAAFCLKFSRNQNIKVNLFGDCRPGPYVSLQRKEY